MLETLYTGISLSDSRNRFFSINFFVLKQLVQDLLPPLSIYIHMCTIAAPLWACHTYVESWVHAGLVHTHTNTYIPRFSPSGFFRPSRYLIPIPGLASSTPSVQCFWQILFGNVHQLSSLCSQKKIRASRGFFFDQPAREQPCGAPCGVCREILDMSY